MKQRLRIGELGRATGVSAQAIRYYESLGLIDQPVRTDSQYRLYSEADVARLQFIRKAKLFDLSLDEIKQLLDLSSQGIQPCQRLDEMVQRHLQALDERIRDMVSFREELCARYEQSRLASDGSKRSICGIIEQQSLPKAD
jgi:DNA-binding transcriptional MerR regulator